ncbi:MAG: hypothetical protein AAF560_16475 [Acidobacteriota bacterium]
MKPFFSGWSIYLLTTLVLVGWAAPSLVAQEEPSPEERQELDRIALELNPADKVAGPVTCTDNRMRGKFADLVNYFYERKDGFASWRLQADGVACVNASGLGCVDTNIVMLKGSDEESLDMNATFDRWLSTAAVAKVLDQEVQIEFTKNPSGWAVCRVERFWVFE